MDGATLDNEEEVYRRIPNDLSFYRIVGGRKALSSSAFNDRARKPSVDRAAMTSAEDVRTARSDGVVRLKVLAIRSVQPPVAIDPNRNNSPNYAIDVLHRPIPPNEGPAENLAHCQIEANPPFSGSARFAKLKEALARLAGVDGWVIEPGAFSD
jgi:hypothetical protein